MSYILDALKKTQSEQHAQGVALRMEGNETRKAMNPWLAAVVLALLLINAGLLLWVFVLQDSAPAIEEEYASRPNPTSQAAPSTTSAKSSVPSTANSSSEQAEQHLTAPASIKPTSTSGITTVPKVALGNLSPAERSLYEGFVYSTHIYTDDPDLCAIVVDGQRLAQGDMFKGLQVIAVTETGVIFEETQRGVKRQVEVSIMELWEN